MKNAKAIVGAVGLVVTALTAALADEVLSFNEIGTIIAVTIESGVTVWGIWRARDFTVNADVRRP
jgi:hypothetical protein